MLTYKQIEKIEQFINEAQGLKQDALSGENFYNLAVALEDRIIARNIGYKSIVSWSACYEKGWNEYTDENWENYLEDKIVENLETIISSLEGLLDACQVYPYIIEVRNDIEKGRELEKFACKNFIIELCAKYQGKVDFGKTAQDYCKNKALLAPSEAEALCKGMLTKLEFYLSDICEEKKMVKAPAQKKETNIYMTQNQTNHQETNVNITITIEDCFKALDDCETLKDDEIEEIKQQLSEIETLLKDKKGKRKAIKEKISNALKWIANKGTDVMVSVLPFVLQSLQGL